MTVTHAEGTAQPRGETSSVELRIAAQKLKRIPGLDSEPIAVFLERGASDAARPFKAVSGHRCCQLLMRARSGESLCTDADGIACPAAAAAFGLRPLPQALASGQGLVGFGFVSDPETGRVMFEGMQRLPAGSVHVIAACPFGMAPSLPDVVMVEGRPEQLMWLLLADLNVDGGRRRVGDTAVLQATCVDATERSSFTWSGE